MAKARTEAAQLGLKKNKSVASNKDDDDDIKSSSSGSSGDGGATGTRAARNRM